MGIVGRTGAGKSSVVAILFRLFDQEHGFVTLGGVDIRSVGLQKLRRVMGIIPQHALLIAGTVRFNVDPFCECAEEDIAKCLALVSLSEQINDDVGTLSAGQQQLLTFARVLLRQQSMKVVVMDEPTSQIDFDTVRCKIVDFFCTHKFTPQDFVSLHAECLVLCMLFVSVSRLIAIVASFASSALPHASRTHPLTCPLKFSV